MIRNLLLYICFFLGAQCLNAQTYRYDKNTDDDYKNNDLCYTCVDYVIQNKVLPINAQQNTHRSKAAVYQLNNSRKIVIVTVNVVQREREIIPDITGRGIMDQYGRRHDYLTRIVDTDQYETYAVFLNENDKPVNAIRMTDIVELKLLDNNRILLYKCTGENSKDFAYRSMGCFDYVGNPIWGDIKSYSYFYQIGYTENNIYTVGGEVIGEYKIFNRNNGNVVLSKQSTSRIPSKFIRMSFMAEGVQVTEQFERGENETHIFPYAPDDKEMQDDLIFRQYNKNKASDQIAIAERYMNGNGFNKDEKKAFEWFQKAANQNDGLGLLNLANCYEKGLGVDRDIKKAADYYEKSANTGNVKAMSIISRMYLNGEGVAANRSKALYWQESLAFKGDKNAKLLMITNKSAVHEKVIMTSQEANQLGEMSLLAKDYDWAIYCFERAIELGGNEQAEFNLGKMYYTGEGVTKNYAMAVSYLSKIAEAGNPTAQEYMGYIYEKGDTSYGINPDVNKQMYWYEKAAQNGDVNAQLKLANAYNAGLGVKKDPKKSFDYYYKAAEKGNQDAIKVIVSRYAKGNGVKKNNNLAMVWFEKVNEAEQLNFADNMFYSNKTLGALMYLNLSAKGNTQAIKKAAMCYLKGDGVKKDYKIAKDLANKYLSITHNDDDGVIHYILGMYSEKTGRRFYAYDYYKAAIKLGYKDAEKAIMRLGYRD